MTSQMQWAQTEPLIKTLSELKEEIVSLSLMKEQLASDIRQLSYKVSDLTEVMEVKSYRRDRERVIKDGWPTVKVR